MSSYSETCLDANVVLRFVSTDTPTPAIKDLWREWTDARVTLHAPALWRYEIVNGLHQLRKAGALGDQEASRALIKALKLPIELHNDGLLHMRAFQLAAEYGLPAAYDAYYLALAERLGLEFWTLDAKLVKAVEDRLAWVRLVS
ncbi:MAG TPA: type II toxin-antitoxin system VapC family toxin [Actinophytocola sp.]|uniref:type II toxin-antitoxin system VapC family toxin n=1 Tax=Actinophytocola sp. TaxID=1872138 RepID=UPI002DDD5186|nr:type II toxin-antitoxin system VapC family toxin [Actinophytocola sp.]HEV2780109.1 type II toxin-antitoxin system VapC family toxin [Actinophytocola sp.]